MDQIERVLVVVEDLSRLSMMCGGADIGGYSDSSREWNYKTTMRINHEGPVHRCRPTPPACIEDNERIRLVRGHK